MSEPKEVEEQKGRDAHAEQYPMCTRLSLSRSEMSKISAFLDWLEEEQDARLCKAEGSDYYPLIKSRERLLREYFEIDEAELEKERRAMLDAQRKLNGDSTKAG